MHLVESFAVSEILKSYSNNLEKCNIYFYRDHNGNEIDLLLEDRGKVHPIEIKMSATPKKDMVKGFRIIPEEDRGMGALICLYPQTALLSADTVIIPISEI